VSGLGRRFLDVFDDVPTHFVRAPGRVNLIGDHIDYNGLPVFPMALQREVRVALRPRDDGWVHLRNVDQEFEPVDFEVHPALERESGGHWANYCMAPAKELARRFAIWRGFDAVVESTVPVAAGLSSSSALVNAIGLALAEVNELELNILTLADLMAEAERFTGTRGGGMDQAISLGARAGHASRISFDPLRLRHVAVPEDWRFVVADTGVRAEKSGPAQLAYNHRRSECEEALALVSATAEARGMVMEAPGSYRELMDKLGLDSIWVAADAALKGKLLRRFRHVISEARRVEEASDHILGGDLHGFGSLMDASHGSLHTDYNVSCPELDALVALAREGGAEGARLTGAGFGGCVVALTDMERVDSVLELMSREYFEPRGMADQLDRHLFVARASRGASVTPLG